MFYYLVWVRSNKYHSKEPLTYASEVKLSAGKIVSVSLQKNQVLGFIGASTTRPRFKTKSVDYVYDLPPLNPELIRLAKWLIDYYPAPLGLITQQFLPASLPIKAEQFKFEPQRPPKTPKLPPLTNEQQAALETIDQANTYLLHGNTGSGKTRVYIELTKKALANGRSSIILTPEISLTSQLYETFEQQFGEHVILMHSKQTAKQRSMGWLKCLTSKQPLVVIGPRSAIFSPLNRLGLIVIDESHEGAYKQEQLPHYQTGRVASTLASLSNATLLIGSATPSISDYFMASEKQKPIIRLTKLAKESANSKPAIKVIDIKDRSNFSSSNILGDQLIAAMKVSLEKKQQSLLYLNRRGTSRLILCDNCGWEALCPNCNLPLTYHGDLHELRCHSCGYKQSNVPSICPVCDNDSIIYRTVGTKAIVDELKRLFVNANIKRFDTDNLSGDRVEQNYDAIRNGNIDILVGTQLLVKGFDLPKLSTVGVLQADTSLYLPDFSSEERTFQLVTQVLGRINRGHIEGTAIIQTYNPHSQLLKRAADQDYASFYEDELIARKNFHFPPYYNLLKLTCRRKSSKAAEQAADKLKEEIQNKTFGVRVEGPTPAFHERYQDKYQWQLVVKTTHRSKLLDIIKYLPASWSYDIDPVNLL